MEEKVSVILVNYNGKEYNDKCIRSILDSTIKSNIHVVVVDNASTDDSLTILRECWGMSQQVTILALDKNYGGSLYEYNLGKKVMICDEMPKGSGTWYNYAMNITLFPQDVWVKFTSLTGSLSQKMLISDATREKDSATSGYRTKIDATDGKEWVRAHGKNSSNILFCDGHAENVNQKRIDWSADTEFPWGKEAAE